MRRPPESPTGVDDLNSQSGIESDAGLVALRAALKEGLSEETFTRLTQFVDDSNVPSEPSAGYRERALEYVEDCIAYREAIRPDSVRAQKELPDGIDRITVGNWVWYFSGIQAVEHDVGKDEADTFERGKYLFFTPEGASHLEEIVVEQFTKRPFESAKIPTIPGKREDWVLCLYQDDNRYWFDLRKEYHNPPRVRFRGFKPDSATRRGEYSERFEKFRSGSS